MKSRLLLCVMFYACLSSTYAVDKMDVSKSGIYLDQSKDIYLEGFSSYAYSLQILQAKNAFNNYDLIVGGSLQIDAQHWHGNRIREVPLRFYKEGKGLYFTQATLDIMGNASQWVTSFLTIADAYIGRPSAEGNDIFLNRAILIFGDVDQFPVYVTVGINTLPFGVFSGSGVWDTPLTGAYFNPAQAPQISVGYYRNGLNVNITKYSDQTNHRNHNIGSIYYNKNIGAFNFSLGAGYLTNLESNATGTTLTHRKRRHVISTGYNLGIIKDINASIGYHQFSISGEYVQGSNSVGINSAIPHAIAVTATYTQNIAGRDTVFGITRSRSYHLADVPVSLAGEDGLPISAEGLKTAWGVSASRSFIRKNISLGANFSKNETYHSKSSYTGTLELYLYL